MLFIDARKVFQLVTRVHREYTPERVEFIGTIVRLWRGHEVEAEKGSA